MSISDLRQTFLPRLIAITCGILVSGLVVDRVDSADPPPPSDPKGEYTSFVKPLLTKYCLDCHSTKVKKSDLDLERFTSLAHVRGDIKPWQAMIEQIEAGEMPPKDKPQPSASDKKRLVAWVRGFLDAEARARSGDPGPAPLRRLSNTEYDYTIRDLTEVNLRPTREFPADGAAGEGFTNAAEALSDISPALLTKYLNAAKDISEHLVLLPDGFRFSPSKTRRDWTDESTAQLRKFFAEFTADGRLPFQPYLLATIRHREGLVAGSLTIDQVAAREKLNAKYLGVLWKTLTDKTPSYPLDVIRSRWRTATEKDSASISADITTWQAVLFKSAPIGSYRYGNMARSVANDPPVADVQPLKLTMKPSPGQSEVTLYLSSSTLFPEEKAGTVLWQRPRFEAMGKPTLLLKDYSEWGARYEIDYSSVFADTPKYLAAAIEAANDRKLTVVDLAKKHGLDAAFLTQWIAVLAVEPYSKDKTEQQTPGRPIPLVALELLSEKTPKNDARPAINGWKKKGTDLPIFVTNSSNKVEMIPGRIPAHGVGVHPMPQEFVAVVWKSPIAGEVRMQARVAHAHPTCGNGVAWWVEHRQGQRAAVIGDGTLDVGKEGALEPRSIKVAVGDSLILAVDARSANHVCDMTEISFTIKEINQPTRVWNLAADVANNVQEGNPHADKLGNKEVWSFVKGPAKPADFFKSAVLLIPSGSVLGQWRSAAASPARNEDARRLAEQTRMLLTGKRPADEKSPDRVLYDNLLAPESPLFQQVDLSKLVKPNPKAIRHGLPKERFTEANLSTPPNQVIEITLPAELFRERAFLVEGKIEGGSDRLVQFQVTTTKAGAAVRWDGKSPVVASATSANYQNLVRGYSEFRKCFPQFICFNQVIPTDEVVSLKMFHREDDDLARLFLDDVQKRRLDHLWIEHRFISRQAILEDEYLPQFIGYVTQDQPKELLNYFESQRPAFRKRAEELTKDLEAAIPRQLEALQAFTAKAYRRPLQEKEKSELLDLYQTIRKKGVTHEEALRGVIARVLVSPSYLFRLEQPRAGKTPQPLNEWELATRLSYFLWSSLPDDELRRMASSGKLREPAVLEEQFRRMLNDERSRALAIEFGAQWLHVRGFDELKEKNEKLFPTFDEKMRKAIYEETILFFHDLFRSDRPVRNILDADYTFLNETLAKHYGIPGVVGEQWRKVDGVKKFGRGGILGLASVQTKESGASRTSPVLRGNWVVETLLGEKLPRPPANVPRLPEEEKGNAGLTMRQLVEKHTRVAECAVCHQRIDPYGFAFEQYDPIGRRRDKDLGGLVVDARAKLRDGTEFEGIDGLRSYLLTKKQDLIVKLFCKKLLGYALGRSVVLSDQTLIDEMVTAVNKNEGKISAALLVILRSPQFRMMRGIDFTE